MDWQYLYFFAQDNAYVLSAGVTLVLLGFFIDRVRGALITTVAAVGAYLLYLNDMLPFGP